MERKLFSWAIGRDPLEVLRSDARAFFDTTRGGLEVDEASAPTEAKAARGGW